MEKAARPPNAQLDRYGRRDRGAAIARNVLVRTSGRPVPRTCEHARFIAAFRWRRPRASVDPRGPMRAKQLATRYADARATRERIEHVRQEHAAAHGRNQRGARAGRRAHPREIVAPLATLARHPPAQHRFAAGRALDVLHRGAPHPASSRSGERRQTDPVPLRRASRWNEFTRPPDRSGKPAARISGARRHRHPDDARSGAHGDGRIARPRLSATCTCRIMWRMAR